MKLKINERNMLIGLAVTFAIFVSLRCVVNIFVFPLVFLLIIVFLKCPISVCVPLLFFLVPSGNLIKFESGQISLFTVAFFILAVRVLCKSGRMKRSFLLCAVFFVGYCLLFTGVEKIILIATMVCGFVIVNELCESDDYDFEEIIMFFCLGLILASVIGLFKDSLPIVKSMLKDATVRVDVGEHVQRFAALTVNPNYFSMDVCVALSCMAVLMISKEINAIRLLVFAVLSVFGIMTISKSFLISLVIIVAFFLLGAFKKGGKSFFGIVTVLVASGVLVYLFAFESIETYIFRLESDSGASLSDITTGRSDLIYIYIKEIIKEIPTLMFGFGLENFIEGLHMPHNTYIEFIYSMGLVGAIVYLIMFKVSFSINIFPKKFLYYVPIFVIGIRFLGINMFTNDAIWYYYALMGLILKYGNAIENKAQKAFERNVDYGHRFVK